MLELKEKSFCTGCGSELKADEIVQEVQRGKAPLPYGARYVGRDTEMKAMCKGLVLGGILGFIMLFVGSKFVMLSHIPIAIGYGIIGALFMSLIVVFAVSQLDDKSKEKLAEGFKSFPVDGPVYHAVDFLVIQFPFLITAPGAHKKKIKEPASRKNRSQPTPKKKGKKKK